jgi:hypothetical protein
MHIFPNCHVILRLEDIGQHCNPRLFLFVFLCKKKKINDLKKNTHVSHVEGLRDVTVLIEDEICNITESKLLLPSPTEGDGKVPLQQVRYSAQ